MAKGWKFVDNSNKIKSLLESASTDAMMAATYLVQSQAKALAPVDSGELRDKIGKRVFNRAGIVTGQVGSPLDYATYVEFGTGEFADNGAGRKGGWYYKDDEGNFHYTKGQKASKFLTKSFRTTKKQVIEIVGDKYKSKL